MKILPMLLSSQLLWTTTTIAATPGSLVTGKEIVFNTKKGNCLACHQIEGGEFPGNLGPPLANMRARFADPKKLRAQIWDAAVVNPNTIMPPFGRMKILSDQEIDQVVDFLYSLK